MLTYVHFQDVRLSFNPVSDRCRQNFGEDTNIQTKLNQSVTCTRLEIQFCSNVLCACFYFFLKDHGICAYYFLRSNSSSIRNSIKARDCNTTSSLLRWNLLPRYLEN